MTARFLFNEELWGELNARIRRSKRTRAAVAYLGTGGNRLLPLRKGDRLVVDMSLRSVRAGSTDPREIRTFLRRGVQVFSRDSLHAKFFLVDRAVIAGSSNISNHARNVLDEAAVLTDDPGAMARASATFDRLCIEPIRGPYLRRCLKEYRPPRFGGPRKGGAKRSRFQQAKVWIVGGLEYRDVPEREELSAKRVARRAKRKLADHERFDVGYVNYPRALDFFRSLRPGDWILQCIGDGSGFDVWPPSRFLGIEHYPRGRGKRRYLLLLEQPLDAEDKLVRWRRLRSSAGGNVAAVDRARPRTLPVRRDEEADALLRLWNITGRFRGRKR